MTIGEFLKPLPSDSIVEWEEWDYDGYDDQEGKLDDELSGEETLEEFLNDEDYGYRMKDLQLYEVSSIEIIPSRLGRNKIKILRQLY